MDSAFSLADRSNCEGLEIRRPDLHSDSHPDSHDVDRLVPAGALDQVELNGLTFDESAVAFADDIGIVNEDVVPAPELNEAPSLAIVKELDGSVVGHACSVNRG